MPVGRALLYLAILSAMSTTASAGLFKKKHRYEPRPCPPVDEPFFGYHPTCWRQWPEGWKGCSETTLSIPTPPPPNPRRSKSIRPESPRLVPVPVADPSKTESPPAAENPASAELQEPPQYLAIP